MLERTWIAPLTLALVFALVLAARPVPARPGIRDGAPVPAPRATPDASMEWDGTLICAFEVPDAKEAAVWYGEMLGCELFLDLSEQGWCEVTTPVEGARIGLGEPEEGEPARGSGGAKLTLGVRSVDAARAHLATRGVEHDEPVVVPETVKLLPFEDPWGNALVLAEPLGEDR